MDLRRQADAAEARDKRGRSRGDEEEGGRRGWDDDGAKPKKKKALRAEEPAAPKRPASERRG